MKNFTIITLFVVCFQLNAQYNINNVVLSNYSLFNTADKVHKVLSYDLNNDGNKDIVIDGGMYVNQSNFLEATNHAIVMLGNGDGSFGNQTFFQKPSVWHSISDFADYNNDGNPDMLVYGFWQNGFTLYTGGAGVMNFTSTQDFNSGTHGYEAKFVDYDNDGDLDILTITSGSAAIVFFHTYTNNNGTFTKASYSLGAQDFYPNYEYVDLNGDDLIDVIANTHHQMKILYQNANHTFTTTTQILNGTYLFDWNQYYISYKDYNNDGILDAVTERNNTLALVNGTATYPYLTASATSETRNPLNLQLYESNQFYPEDIDNDGYTDIISYTGQDFTNTNDKIVIYFDPFNLNNNQSELTLPINAESIHLSFKSLLFEDFNNDNKKDILAFGKDKIRVFTNQQTLSENEFTSDSNNLKVYPVPSNEIINVNYKNNEDNFKIFDNLGREIMSIDSNATISSTNINIQTLQNGVYTLIGFVNGTKVSSKIILKN